MELKKPQSIRVERIRGTDLWINSLIAILCHTCGKSYEADTERQTEDLNAFLDEVAEDATAKGWRFVDEWVYCRDCIRTASAEAGDDVSYRDTPHE